MSEPIEHRYELWEKFLARFPLEKLNSISLEENSLSRNEAGW